MMRHNTKPVRKCHGCELNFRTHCGYYAEPFRMWLAGPCPGYNNRQLIAKMQQQTQRVASGRQRRRALAKTRTYGRRRPGPRQRGRYGGVIGR